LGGVPDPGVALDPANGIPGERAPSCALTEAETVLARAHQVSTDLATLCAMEKLG
jgi:hypothetical protein